MTVLCADHFDSGDGAGQLGVGVEIHVFEGEQVGYQLKSHDYSVDVLFLAFSVLFGEVDGHPRVKTFAPPFDSVVAPVQRLNLAGGGTAIQIGSVAVVAGRDREGEKHPVSAGLYTR